MKHRRDQRRHAITLAVALALSGCAATSGQPSGQAGTPATSFDATRRISSSAVSTAGETAPAENPGLSGPRAPTGQTVTATVVRIVDGDTIQVLVGTTKFKVRYIGMDTPETVKPGSSVERFGKEATAANRRLVEGRRVILERDVSDTDRYGRLLRYVWLREGSGWLLVNLELVATGYAQVATFPPDVKYAEDFLAAERAARMAGLGLWAP